MDRNVQVVIVVIIIYLMQEKCNDKIAHLKP